MTATNRFEAAGLTPSMMPGPYFDADGRFRSVEYATQHALMVQGGFSTTQIEAERMTRHSDEIVRTMGERFLAGDPMDVLEPAPTRERYIANSEARTLSPFPAEATPQTNTLRRARKAARTILAARAAKKDADAQIAKVKDGLLADMDALGTDVIEVEGDGKVQRVTPVSVRITDEADVLKAIAQHRPELMDTLTNRSVNKDALSRAIENGDVPASWSRFLKQHTGTTQIR